MSQTLRAVAATAQRLQSASTTFLPQRRLIVPNGVSEPTGQLLKDLETLASAAHSAADSVLCSSILAGHSSESDDFADVSVWLGPGSYGKGNEQTVLNKLGLDSKGGRVSSVDLSAQCIPVTVNMESSTPQMADLSAQLANLKDLHCFLMHPTSGSDVIYSLIGKHANGWGGLVGIGTWSDD
ncbi:hypothetical protein B0H15DRAFT_859706 [Mycena belliarum]|uniref:Uncharacterized protein n=1 Tax=Mycena belliarum TaxID=1033014 RepID=A0AAD6XL77_9AGAR|nr:hypothetical protein B0H15DRAFT_859706 [Mycena belliae]